MFRLLTHFDVLSYYYDQTIASLHQEVAALKEANLRTSLYYDNQPGYAAQTTNNVGYS